MSMEEGDSGEDLDRGSRQGSSGAWRGGGQRESDGAR
jgi:hypothetical protein